MKNLAIGVTMTLFVVGQSQGYQATYTSAPYQEDESDNCGKHQILVGHNCQCKKGYIWFKGKCNRCPEGSRYSCKTKTCKCDEGYLFCNDTFTCKKVKPSYTPDKQGYAKNKYGNEYDKNQKIPVDYTKKDSYKLPKGGPYGPNGKCPKMSYWSAEFPCTCNWGLGWYNYECVPDCGVNQVPTPGGGCTCRPGYNMYDGVNCTYCPPRSYWEDGACYCEWGLVQKNGNCIDPYAQDYGSASYGESKGYSSKKSTY